MYILNVNGNKYKIQFKYRTLLGTDIIDKVVGIGSIVDVSKPADTLKGVIGLTAEMLLVGLQANHNDQFGYDTDDERKERMLEVLDLIDDYEAENTDDDGNCEKNGYTLFVDMQGELERNGFLSAMMKMDQQAAAEQNATVIPMDHQEKKKKAGEKK